MDIRVLNEQIRENRFVFDEFFEWRAVGRRVVPALRAAAGVELGPDHIELLTDASSLFGETPCLQQPAKTDILVEGDSWMCLAIYPGHETMVQRLARMGYKVENVARYGRTSDDVEARKASASGYYTLLRDRRPKAFLLSMGGNDFLGPLVASWLAQRNSGDVDPSNAHLYVNQNFAPMLAALRSNYEQVAATVRGISPHTALLFQTYTYAAQPTHPTGPFLGQWFDAKGFDPINPDHRPLIAAIIKLVLDRFHQVLSGVKSSNPDLRIDIVDFRKALRIQDIRDEIHPMSRMAASMAMAYTPYLRDIGIEPAVA